MALDLSDPVTLVALAVFALVSVYWWYRWQWRHAWFERVIAEAAREHDDEDDDDSGR